MPSPLAALLGLAEAAVPAPNDDDDVDVGHMGLRWSLPWLKTVGDDGGKPCGKP